MKLLIWVWVFFLPIKAIAQTPNLQLTNYASGLYRPTDIETAGDGRLFVSQMDGKIMIIENGMVNPIPFLDISAKIKGPEYQGIFGFTFHSNYNSNGYVFVHYLIPNNEYSRYSRFTRNSQYPNILDSNSEVVIYEVPYSNNGHRSGDLNFGPDGYLYITTGDGSPGARGSIGDPTGKAQNLQNVFGKILRINVDAALPYTIPPANPYLMANDGIPDEIWGAGLRNPWRWSFDKQTGDMWLGDNGQDGWEEVDFLKNSFTGIVNFGWPCFEGSHAYLSSFCNTQPQSISPQIEYPGYDNNSQLAASVLGGYVYRGSQYQSLKGWYIYADYSKGNFWTYKKGSTNSPTSKIGALETDQNILQNITLTNPVSFGQDQNGELYVATFFEGNIYKIGDISVTLPLKLKSFTVHNEAKDYAAIEWETTDECKLDYFEIQYSIDGRKFESLGKVQSNGNNEQLSNKYKYKFNILKISSLENILYFRLNWTEQNEQKQYSDIIALNIENKKTDFNRLFPNPLEQKEYSFEILAKNYTNFSLKVYTTSGVLLHKFEYPIYKGLNTLPINFGVYEKGIYIVEIETKNDRKFQKIIIK